MLSENVFLDDGLTVGKLREALQGYPDDLPVGVFGHYGEFIQMNWGGYYHNSRRYGSVVEMQCVDLGEAPD